MQEMRVCSLGWKDPLEWEMATNSSILAWRIPRIEEPSRLQPMGSQRVIHDWAQHHHCYSRFTMLWESTQQSDSVTYIYIRVCVCVCVCVCVSIRGVSNTESWAFHNQNGCTNMERERNRNTLWYCVGIGSIDVNSWFSINMDSNVCILHNV